MSSTKISIRIPDEMLQKYKTVSAYEGVKYQALMKTALQKFMREHERTKEIVDTLSEEAQENGFYD